ncbi:MAG: PAS domain S-box protein [Desulfococcaceae bacterium]|jgi:PAS domain S-box-containing protein|nr:PAS domain S-box protein [Desulfococcaceae bacterium]
MKDEKIVVFAIDENPDNLALFHRILPDISGRPVEFHPFDNWEECRTAIAERTLDILFTDGNPDNPRGAEIIPPQQKQGEKQAVFLLGPAGNEEVVLQYIKTGDNHYLPKKELTPALLQKAIGNALHHREAEEDFFQIFSMSPDMICIADINTATFLKVNPAFTETLGFSEEEFLQKPFLDFIHPDDVEATRSVVKNELKSGSKVINFENRYLCKDGTYRWLNWVSHPVPEKGKTYAVAHDITERKRTDIKLEESRRLLEYSGRMARVGGWELDAESMEVIWTDETYRIHEVPLHQKPSLEEALLFFHPEDRKRLTDAIESALHQGQPYDLELRFITAKGKHLWTRANCQPEVVRGRTVRLRGIFQDITDRRQAEESLRESEERFRALHNASFGGIVIHDRGIILECNQGISDITGYSAKELTGMDGLLLIAEEAREMVMSNILAGYEKPYEATGLRKNGEKYPLRLEARNVPYKGKKVRTVEFRDISEMKQAEALREKLEAQLTQAQKMEAVGRLAGGVAHDFNNMLSVIIGHAEMLLDLAEPVRPFYTGLEEIKKAAVRSAELTRQLLAFARRQTVAPRVLNLNLTLEGMAKMLHRLIGEDISLSWIPGKDLWPVRIDPAQIDQILANLCVNARDAISGVGRITVETKNIALDQDYCTAHSGFIPGEYVMLAVSDNGCGMDAETQKHIFEPFFTTKEMGKGTGLGLATIYGVVKQNKGFIYVYSEKNQGTVFKIYLPRYRGDAVQMQKESLQESPVQGKEMILLVEDEPAILKMVTMILEKMGYRVFAADSPSEAIRFAQKHAGQIHLLMTDVVMPEMNGRDLAKKIKLLQDGIRCLFMSGYTANVIAHHGVLEPGVHFIQKPFTKKSLALKIRKILDEKL